MGVQTRPTSPQEYFRTCLLDRWEASLRLHASGSLPLLQGPQHHPQHPLARPHPQVASLHDERQMNSYPEQPLRPNALLFRNRNHWMRMMSPTCWKPLPMTQRQMREAHPCPTGGMASGSRLQLGEAVARNRAQILHSVTKKRCVVAS